MMILPGYIALTFGATVLLAFWLFSKAVHYSKKVLIFLFGVIIIQSALAVSGFYSDPLTMSNRFPLLVIPVTLFFVVMFLTTSGRRFIDTLDIKTLTILHVIRIPVEFVLFWLFAHKTISEAMTFEGRNFDILSGLTAPLIYYFGFIKKRIGRTAMIAWNIACMLLLINVVTNAVLSLPARYQNFGFEQPNIAVGYFPFVLLPAVLVPIVLFANAAAIRQLVVNKAL